MGTSNLADIQRGFRELKSYIEIALVYHHLPDRICALVPYFAMRLKAKNHYASQRPADCA
jgi:hypothetical protein